MTQHIALIVEFFLKHETFSKTFSSCTRKVKHARILIRIFLRATQEENHLELSLLSNRDANVKLSLFQTMECGFKLFQCDVKML